MGNRQCRMTTEVDFQRGREPAQVESIRSPDKEGGLGQVHFKSNVLHPCGIAREGQQANRGWITGEWPIGKGVYLGESLRAHGLMASARVSAEGSDLCRARAQRPTQPWRSVPTARFGCRSRLGDARVSAGVGWARQAW